MHEVGIMRETLELAGRRLAETGGVRIHVLRLKVGQLSGVVPDALQFAFEVLRSGTAAAEARLEVEEVPAVGWCEACGREFEAADLVWSCPECGECSDQLRRGRELELVSMEIT